MRMLIVSTLMLGMFMLPFPSLARTITGEEAMALSMNRMNLALYETLLEESEGNLIYSPFSIHTALTMTELGAAGETADQMRELLGLAGPEGEIDLQQGRDAVAGLAGSIQDAAEDQGYVFSVANRLYGQAGYGFLEPFLKGVEETFGAGLVEVDFGDTEAARQMINTWVEEQTRERITNLIAEGVLTPLTRLVLVNAVYFKGEWALPFDPELTAAGPFYRDGGQGDPVDAAMMHQTATAPFGEFDWGKALLLPYGKGRLGMLVLLPERDAGLADLENALASTGMEDIMDGLREASVDITLPRWKNTITVDLESKLATMGMPDAFSQGAADFSPMNGGRDLYITKVVHKAFIEVNEEGSEAAAATAVIVGTRSVSPVENRSFLADRPFLYAIVDRATSVVLFMGRLMDPASEGE